MGEPYLKNILSPRRYTDPNQGVEIKKKNPGL